MGGFQALPGETERVHLRPHPFSFGVHYFVAWWPAIWAGVLALVVRTDWWQSAGDGPWWKVWTHLYGNDLSGYALAVIGLLLVSVPAALLQVRWRLVGWHLLVAAGAITGAILIAKPPTRLETALPLLMVAAAIVHATGVDLWRRSHHYRITDFRIVFQGGFLVSKERQIRYDAVTDLDISQSLLGRILDYGTIIPITQSGFGLGEDQASAAVTLGAGAKKGGLFGGGALTAGGGRSVQTGRARTFHQLTGVAPFRDVKRLIEELAQGATLSPQLRQQTDLQQAMVDKLSALNDRLDNVNR